MNDAKDAKADRFLGRELRAKIPHPVLVDASEETSIAQLHKLRSNEITWLCSAEEKVFHLKCFKDACEYTIHPVIL